MWKCENCETLNEDKFCVVCGAEKPEEKRQEFPKRCEKVYQNFEEKNENEKGKKTVFVVLAIIIGIILVACVATECAYAGAQSMIDKGNYGEARHVLNWIFFYKDSPELLIECDCMEARFEMSVGETEKAKAILSGISDRKDVEELLLECDYQKALNQKSQGELIEAFDLFATLGGYSDSENQWRELKALIYEQGVYLYQIGGYVVARQYLEKSVDFGREGDYLRLIPAHITTISDVTAIYDLIGFEDTNDLLLSDKYIDEFMLGRWEDYEGNFVEYYKNNQGDLQSNYNLPWTEGKYYELKEGVHFNGSDEVGWTKQWSYRIVTADKIEVYCYKDGKTYMLYRK